MTILTNTTTDAEFQKKFKSKINFGDLLDKNDKKNEGTTVSGLLKSTTQTIVAPQTQELDKKLEDIEQNIERKVERVESLLQSVIISQQNFQLNVREDLHETFKDKLLTHEKPAPAASTIIKEEKVSDNKNIIIASLIMAASILSVALILNKAPSEVDQINLEAPATKASLGTSASPATPAAKTINYVATKFVNMRDSASTKASIMMVVPPNSIIELLESNGGWNKIKFTDHVKGESLTGWVYGENLKLLK